MTKSKNQIIRPPGKRLTKRQLRQLASFTDPSTILSELAKSGWTVEDSIRHLVEIAKGEKEGVKTSTQLNALRYLNQLITDAMERSGLMVIATKKMVGEGGQEIRFSGQVISSILGNQENETTPTELREGKEHNGKDKEEDKEESKKEGRRDRREDGLHSSKPPTGQEAAAGHYDGIARGEENIGGDTVGDFL